MAKWIGRLIREEEGQDLIEYALLAALIALAATVAMQTLGTGISALFGKVNTKLGESVPATP